jgi:hypothetical protein
VGHPRPEAHPGAGRRGDKGICGHADITAAFPQDNGTHTDPGPTFPWSQFLGLVQAEMEDDMTADELFDALESARGRAAIAAAAGSGVHGQKIGKSSITIGMAFERLLVADGVDEQAIVTGVLAGLPGLTPAAIAAAIPPEIASDVADEIAARLGRPA